MIAFLARFAEFSSSPQYRLDAKIPLSLRQEFPGTNKLFFHMCHVSLTFNRAYINYIIPYSQSVLRYGTVYKNKKELLVGMATSNLRNLINFRVLCNQLLFRLYLGSFST